MLKRLASLPKQAFKAILANKGRSFLTVLGIVIGIASVVSLISLGGAVRTKFTKRFLELGTSNVIVHPGEPDDASGAGETGSGMQEMHGDNNGPGMGMGNKAVSTLTMDDLNSLRTGNHPKIRAVSGIINSSMVLKVGGKERRYNLAAVSAGYFAINNLSLSKGSLFTANDETKKRSLLVLGSDMAHDLYGNKNPIGRILTSMGKDFKVAGVLKRAEENSLYDSNTQAFVPVTIASGADGTANLSLITVQAKSDKDVKAVKTDVRKTILANHEITDEKLADFEVLSARDMLSTIDQITGTLTMFLAGIAAISLVVGGIGIMNIMLVSVTERTREIGLRMAVGANTFDIISQFLVEAVILTFLGGLIGIGFGTLLAKTMAENMIKAPAVITGNAILLAVGVSSAVGVVFGLYPAIKASRFNPIDALRYE